MWQHGPSQTTNRGAVDHKTQHATCTAPFCALCRRPSLSPQPSGGRVCHHHLPPATPEVHGGEEGQKTLEKEKKAKNSTHLCASPQTHNVQGQHEVRWRGVLKRLALAYDTTWEDTDDRYHYKDDFTQKYMAIRTPERHVSSKRRAHVPLCPNKFKPRLPRCLSASIATEQGQSTLVVAKCKRWKEPK